MNKLVIYIIIMVSALFVACDSNVIFDDNQKVENSTWNMQQKKTFTVNIKTIDRTSLYRFAINISNTKDYKYNNIYFFLTTIYPDESISIDTIECELTHPDGTWKGKEFGGVIDNRFWFAHNVEFKQNGIYTFRLQQATTDTNLVGVKNIGLHIEKMPNRK